MYRYLILVFALLLGAACSSSGTSGSSHPEITGIPMTIKLYDYRSGLVVGLVNDSHSDRIAAYSEERSDAGIKITSDEIVSATIEFVQDKGFEQYAMRGLAPMRSDAYSKCIEVDDPSGVRYFGISRSSSTEERVVMANCYAGLLDVYNRVHGSQSVSNASGAGLFYDQQSQLVNDKNKNRN